jgi:tricarballylate dehydrogenase
MASVVVGRVAPDSAPAFATTTADRDLSAKPGTPDWTKGLWDLVIIGGGNAAISAAMAADDSGARVLMLERAPRGMRGGNTRHTRNIRCVNARDGYIPGGYSFDQLWSDLCGVGEGPNNEELARFTVKASESIPHWMQAHGARWQKPLAGTLHLGATNRFFLGGGKTLLNSYYRELAKRHRITAVFDAEVEQFEIDGDRCKGVIVFYAGVSHRVTAKAVLCASGGFEANIEWLRSLWGDAADNFFIRGTPFNDGRVLSLLYDANAASAGMQRGFHAIAIDARAPRFDGGIATRLDTIPFGIAVNKFGQRFYDEGEDIWPKRYATWGGLIATQPDQIATSLWDARVNSLFLPPMYPAAQANTIGDLAVALGLDPKAVGAAVDEFNASIDPKGTFDPRVLDDCATRGLAIPKSHWAQPLDRPPFRGIRMRPGITFTYMGVQVDASARVVRVDGSRFENVFAAGEIMSGNILSTAYLAGFGMTIGAVWGRHAGMEVGKYVA